MILFVHMLFGAAIGSVIQNPILAILLALLGHYFLDLFPHIEYSIDNLRSKVWKKSLPDLTKVAADFWLAVLVIFLVSKNQPIIYICAVVAAIPDAFTVISSVFENKVLKMHDKIHTKHIHYLTKQKKFPVSWKIATQVLAVVVSLVMFRL